MICDTMISYLRNSITAIYDELQQILTLDYPEQSDDI